MAYIKYNSGVINYYNNISEPKLIISDIIDSPCGPEKPKAIRTIQDFDIYFGQEFEMRDYYRELFKNGVQFLAGRPISTKMDPLSEGFIDYYDWPEITIYETLDNPDNLILHYNNIYYYWIGTQYKKVSTSDILEVDFFEENINISKNIILIISKEDKSFYLRKNNIITEAICYENKIENPYKTIYFNPITFVKFIWSNELEDFINIELLEQNLEVEENSVSWKNRDSLRLTCLDSGISYCHPRYNSKTTYNTSPLITTISDKDLGKIETKDKTIALYIDFTNVEKFYPDNDTDGAYYLVIPYIDEKKEDKITNIIFWFKRDWVTDDIIPLGSDFIANCNIIPVPISKDTKKQDIIDFIFSDHKGILRTIESYLEVLLEKGEKYLFENLNKLLITNSKSSIYNSEIKEYLNYNTENFDGEKGFIFLRSTLRNRYFYDLPGLVLKEDYYSSHDLLAQLTEGCARMDFYSKTLGPASDNIKIKIEKLQYYSFKYRVTISRYDYVEVFEGNIFTDIDYKGEISYLESIINKSSKLVRCKIYLKYSLDCNEITKYKKGESKDFIIDNNKTYYIKNSKNYPAIIENINYKNYIKTSKITVSELPDNPEQLIYKAKKNYYSWTNTGFIQTTESQDYIELPFLPKRLEDIIFNIELTDEEKNLGKKEYSFFYKNNAYNLYYSGELREGTWELRRAVVEQYSVDMYLNTLKTLKEFDIQEDFFVVPDIYKYHQKESLSFDVEEAYFPVYETFLDYAKTKNCQVLIENKDIYKDYEVKSVSDLIEKPQDKTVYIKKYPDNSIDIYMNNSGEYENVSDNFELVVGLSKKNNYLHNYTGDLSNRLVYFYSEVYINDFIRPGYYVFIRNLLNNSTYSDFPSLNYYPPVEAYSDNYGDYELFKSNFLTCNNHKYFYRKLFNHTGDDIFESSIIVRFIQSYVSRQFMNNRGEFMGKSVADLADLQSYANGLLGRIKVYFSSYIQYILLDSFEMDKKNIYIDISIGIHEIVDTDINLSLTLNYIS